MHTPPDTPLCRRLLVGGRVQGVGFRPFVYRIALAHGVHGSVQNLGGEVAIRVCGSQSALEAFCHNLLHAAPPLARPELLAQTDIDAFAADGFHILPSDAERSRQIHIPPDQFACPDCLNELATPGERRYRYPFTNCTQCGPRYTLIARLPYDRPNTSMASFPLCPECASEYTDPTDRRFHAQPLACPACGPQLTFVGANPGHHEPLEAAITALRSGAIVAVKGVGGYHLMCSAHDAVAVARLRERKPRPSKPLALLYPWRGCDGLDRLRTDLAPTESEAALLSDPMRPIVLVSRRSGSSLPDAIAPGLDEIGALLPYSPLHQLIADGFDGPLVATSGNLSGEPVLIDNHEAEQRLAHVADAFLHHDRPILRPADDPLYRSLGGRPRPLRLGRGNAPLELSLPFTLEHPVLAVGGEMKGSIALAWDRRVVISPHIGELHAPRTLALFERLCAELPELYAIEPKALICDAHPGYHASRWAQAQGIPVQPVQHHAAHASALYDESGNNSPWLVFTWDGVGLGDDGTLWGTEALFGRPGSWQRVATLRPLQLPGGDKAARQPWRSGAALCWGAGLDWPQAPAESTLLQQAWSRRLNCSESHAAGRLFDAASALLGLGHEVSYEGEAGLRLEAAARRASPAPAPPLPLLQNNELLQIDWRELPAELLSEHSSLEAKAHRFHARLAASLVAVSRQLHADYPFTHVGLTGGVFQNRLLCELATSGLQDAGFKPVLVQQVPCNDAGLAFGQVIEYGYSNNNGTADHRPSDGT